MAYIVILLHNDFPFIIHISSTLSLSFSASFAGAVSTTIRFRDFVKFATHKEKYLPKALNFVSFLQTLLIFYFLNDF